jgi:flagellar biosynthetic protein FliR
VVEILSQSAVQEGLRHAIVLGLLVSARLGPIVLLVPYFGGRATPAQVKVALGLALAVLVYPVVWRGTMFAGVMSAGGTLHPVGVVGLVVKEMAVGLVIGYVASLAFHAARMAGRVIDTSAGHNKATSFAPQLGTQVSVTGDLLLQAAVALFLVVGGHRFFLRVLVRSFEVVPPYGLPLADVAGLGSVAFGVAELTGEAILLGVELAIPVMATVLLVNVALALVNKAAPRLDVFFLGMPIKAASATLVVMLVVDAMARRLLGGAASQLDVLAGMLQQTGGM